MEENIIVRKYVPLDRAKIREICSDTAYMGKPVENFFFDREIFSDIVTLYYTDFEPDSFWVAEKNNEVIGYLSGCMDTSRYINFMKRRIIPPIFLRALFRGIFFRVQTWRLMYFAFRSLAASGFKRELPLDKYPAHLHIDVIKDFRGSHVGRRLIERFLQQAAESGVKGIHLTTLHDNTNACNFFEKMGFTVLTKNPVYIPTGRTARPGFSLLYVKSL